MRDAELVERARAGEDAAFRSLYERHYAAAVAVARARIDDRHLAEDAAQEAFAAFAALDAIRQPDRFASWVATVARREAVKTARRLKRHRRLRREAEPHIPAEPQDADPDVAAAVRALPPKAREAVLMHYFAGLSHADAAAALGVSEGAFHGRLQRARRVLREQLTPIGRTTT